MMMIIIIINVKLADSIKTNSGNAVSNIIPRGDNYKTEVKEINEILVELRRKNGISLIRNNSINSKRHLRRSKLHLNDASISFLGRNFKLFFTSYSMNFKRIRESIK